MAPEAFQRAESIVLIDSWLQMVFLLFGIWVPDSEVESA
jgi:hypothetical protein